VALHAEKSLAHPRDRFMFAREILDGSKSRSGLLIVLQRLLCISDFAAHISQSVQNTCFFVAVTDPSKQWFRNFVIALRSLEFASCDCEGSESDADTTE